MGKRSGPTVIKKYANRRLYHTGTSSYVTLEDLARMVKDDEAFVVQDAKTGEDITRSVLTQIIFEQEGKGQNLLPIAFLRQLIQFYGDSVQALVPSYLEASLSTFAQNSDEMRERMAKAFDPSGFGLVEEQVRRNVDLFQQAMRVWTPFPEASSKSAPNSEGSPGSGQGGEAEIDALRRQVDELQKSIDTIAKRK